MNGYLRCYSYSFHANPIHVCRGISCKGKHFQVVFTKQPISVFVDYCQAFHCQRWHFICMKTVLHVPSWLCVGNLLFYTLLWQSFSKTALVAWFPGLHPPHLWLLVVCNMPGRSGYVLWIDTGRTLWLFLIMSIRGLEPRAFTRQHQYCLLFGTLRMGWHDTWSITQGAN